jgi:hypothetical protein
MNWTQFALNRGTVPATSRSVHQHATATLFLYNGKRLDPLETVVRKLFMPLIRLSTDGSGQSTGA